MEELIEDYLRSIYGEYAISIKNWNVDGANCYVEFYMDEYKYYKESLNINVWDMLVFLNKK